MSDLPKKKRTVKLMSIWLRLMSVTVFALFVMLAGFAFGRGDMSSGVANSIISVFWLGMLIIMHFDAINDAKFDAEMRELERFTKILKELADMSDRAKKASDEAVKEATKKQDEEHLHDVLMAIIKDVMGDEPRALTPEDVAKIEAAFHENTDHYVKINAQLGGMHIHMSNKPIATEPADLAPGVATTAAAPKPLTKSQQKRINAQKGHGPITDDELKAKRLEARRMKRAAKKPAADKPLPGQTELVPSEPTNKE